MKRRTQHTRNRLYRSREDRVLMGVCGGIAEHFGFSPWGVRIVFLLICLFCNVGIFVPVILYFVLGVTLKESPPRPFVTDEEEDFWNMYQTSRPDALRKVHRRFQSLDKRLQRMESIVTSPGFELEEEYRRL